MSEDLREFHKFLLENRVTVSELWTLLQAYENELREKDCHIELYPYLRTCFSRTVPDSDPEGTAVAINYDSEDGTNDAPVYSVFDSTRAASVQAGDSDRKCTDSEPVGYAPGETAFDVSPDYKISTP